MFGVQLSYQSSLFSQYVGPLITTLGHMIRARHNAPISELILVRIIKKNYDSKILCVEKSLESSLFHEVEE